MSDSVDKIFFWFLLDNNTISKKYRKKTLVRGFNINRSAGEYVTTYLLMRSYRDKIKEYHLRKSIEEHLISKKLYKYSVNFARHLVYTYESFISLNNYSWNESQNK